MELIIRCRWPRLLTILLTLALHALPGLAYITFTNSDWSVESGVPFTFKWAQADGPVDIDVVLESKSFEQINIASGIQETQNFTWTPPPLDPGVYVFRISTPPTEQNSEGEFNYSPSFEVAGTRNTIDNNSPSPTPSTTAPETATPGDTQSGSPSGLSAGTKAGIAVGGVAAGIVLLTIALFLAYRHGKAAASKDQVGTAELGEKEVDDPPAELDPEGNVKAELGSTPAASELSDKPLVFEMDAGVDGRVSCPVSPLSPDADRGETGQGLGQQSHEDGLDRICEKQGS